MEIGNKRKIRIKKKYADVIRMMKKALIFLLFSLTQVDLTCRNTKQAVGALFTRTNFVTFKYVTDGWGTDSNGFKMVITAVKDPSMFYVHFFPFISRRLTQAIWNNF